MPNTVVVSAISEYRPDGSYWISSTVNGAAFPFRWTRPLDVQPGGQTVAQAISDRYTRLVTPITTYLVGQTVTVPALVFPPLTYTVVFSAVAASVYSIVGPSTVTITATVNTVSTTVQFGIEELIEYFAANVPAAISVVASKLAKTYADSVRWGAPYIGTFTTN
jgi:hypothetical protein